MVKINVEKLDQLKADADKIFLLPDGEKALVQLLDIQKQVEAAIDEAKQRLETAALKVNPNFSSIQGDRIKVYYREYGAKFYVDDTQADLIPAGLVVERVSYSVDSKAVENWVDEKGKMPTGIKEVERKKTISISLKNGR
jgi:hypothetical protein